MTIEKYDYYTEQLNELELDCEQYDYYKSELDNLYYNDKLSYKNGTLFNNASSLLKCAIKCAKNNKEK